jgi:hypothetical protein
MISARLIFNIISLRMILQK